MKTIIDYTDYRACLCDWLESRKAGGLPVSNRWFAMKMGVNSSSWLTSLLQGRKNLSKESANRLSALMKHDAFEARYFETLVFFNQARRLEERNRYYAELQAMRKGRTIKTLSAGQYDFYTCWYHSVVRSLIGMHGFHGDFAGLAAQVSPQISESQARRSVDLLMRLGMIIQDQTGAYTLADTAITSGDTVHSLAVANFQQETMRLAQEAADRFPPEQRDIRTLTAGISARTYGEIRAILADARRRIVELANADQEADRVYQVNMQVFPLSKVAGRERKR